MLKDVQKLISDLDEIPDKENMERVGQFGNNFYLLFKGLLFKDEFSEVNPLKRIYLKRAEDLGEPWKRFIEKNSQLLSDLKDVLEKEDVYSRVKGLYRDFVMAKDFKGADEYERRIHPKLGIDALRIPIWRRLNALLEEADKAMRECGIDPAEFYG